MGYSKNQARDTVEMFLLKRDHSQCGLCGKSLLDCNDKEIDHIILTSDGGTNDMQNLHLVHRDCHMEKHAALMQKIMNGTGLKKPYGMNEVRRKYYGEMANLIKEKLKTRQSITSMALELNISRPAVYDLIRKFQLR
jgi:Zn-finger protein